MQGGKALRPGYLGVAAVVSQHTARVVAALQVFLKRRLPPQPGLGPAASPQPAASGNLEVVGN